MDIKSSCTGKEGLDARDQAEQSIIVALRVCVCVWHVHRVGKDYRATDHVNPVDGDEVPVPHFGAALTVEEFHKLADRLKSCDIKFIIEPHLRFEGRPGEQYTMFFKVSVLSRLRRKWVTLRQ